MSPHPQAILFDLDGTLIDSVPDLAWAVDEMCKQIGMPACGEAMVRNWVGNGIDMLVRRALTNGDDQQVVDPNQLDSALSSFKSLYASHLSVSTTVYPHLEAVLAQFHAQKIKMAVVTNKGSQFSAQLLADLSLQQWFSVLVGGDTLAVKKPDPQPLLHAAEQLGLRADQVIMIGDSKNDVSAARAANMPVITKTNGYNHGENIANSQPDAIFDCFSELPEKVAQVWQTGQ